MCTCMCAKRECTHIYLRDPEPTAGMCSGEHVLCVLWCVFVVKWVHVWIYIIISCSHIIGRTASRLLYFDMTTWAVLWFSHLCVVIQTTFVWVYTQPDKHSHKCTYAGPQADCWNWWRQHELYYNWFEEALTVYLMWLVCVLVSYTSAVHIADFSWCAGT